MSGRDQPPDAGERESAACPSTGVDGHAVSRSPVAHDLGTPRQVTDRVELVTDFLRWALDDRQRTVRLIALIIVVALGVATITFVIQFRADMWAAAMMLAASVIGITGLRRRRGAAREGIDAPTEGDEPT